MATFDLLQVLMTAVNSDWYSGFIGKPAVNITSVLRPGTLDRLFARLRRASSTLRTPKSASALYKDGPIDGAPSDATMTEESGFGETTDPFRPLTTCFSRTESAVKFWEMRTLPPKSAIAIKRSGPALASINFAAAALAWTWSPV